MSPTPDTLSQNLRYLCADRPSVASVCRDIGMNHQQFSKYLSGNTRPSPNNLRRIARYFGVTEAQLLGPASELELRAQRTSRTESERRRDPLIDVFPGDLGRMRPILGAYHVYFRAPFDPTKVVVNAAFLDERNGVVYSRIIEALRLPHIGSRRWTRCDGKATHQAGQIFVIDCERGSEPVPGFYALTVPHRQKKPIPFWHHVVSGILTTANPCFVAGGLEADRHFSVCA